MTDKAVTKGIILAGGHGTRLYPMTKIVSKQLQTIYDKPMIYYPLATLMLGGIKDILIISTPKDLPNYKELLGDGSNFGIKLTYKAQIEPKGLAEAFIYGADHIGNDQVCLILGDNLFYGKLDFFREAIDNNSGGTVFAYSVDKPSDYGVVEFDKNGKVLSIEEKPKEPKSRYAIPGLYIFDSKVVDFAKSLKPSARGELEITDIQNKYLERDELKCQKIGRGIAWLDTGTPNNLLNASNFIEAIESRQGKKIACLEEIALYMKFLNLDEYKSVVDKMPNCAYKEYCRSLVQEYEV